MTREDERRANQSRRMEKRMENKKQRERDKQQKIIKLTEKANKNFHRAGKLRKKSLICALHCGEALSEIKDLVGHGNWGDWIENNFDGSLRTAEVYMGVAKHWGEPRIAEMREKDIEIDSIKAFQEALEGKTEKNVADQDWEISSGSGLLNGKTVGEGEKKDIVVRRYKKYIISEFRKEVNGLDCFKKASGRYRVFMLGDYFHYFWDKLYIELKTLAKEAERKAKRRIQKTGTKTKKRKQKIRDKAIVKVADEKIYKTKGKHLSEKEVKYLTETLYRTDKNIKQKNRANSKRRKKKSIPKKSNK